MKDYSVCVVKGELCLQRAKYALPHRGMLSARVFYIFTHFLGSFEMNKYLAL